MTWHQAEGPPNYVNPPSIGWKTETAALTTLIAAIVLVVARMYTKLCITRTPGWEDYSIIVALCLAIARTVIEYLSTQVYGLGVHFKDVNPKHYNAFLASSAVDGYLYMLLLMFAKLSLLGFLYRIFSVDRRFRYTAWVVGAIITLWTVVSFFLSLFSCQPFIAQFKLKMRLDPKTKCRPENYEVMNYYGFCSILSDFALLCMPMPMLYQLKMPAAKKFGLAVVFATGGVISGIAIYRQYVMFTQPQAADPSWQLVPSQMWMILEANLSIVCACLPVLTPLARKASVLARFLPEYIRDKISSPSEMEKASWPEVLNGPRHDLERGSDIPGASVKTPWREPSESGDSEDSAESAQTMYHHANLPVRSVILKADAEMGKPRT